MGKYARIILSIFREHYRSGVHSFAFERDEIKLAAEREGIAPPKNLGDVIYSFRYRRPLPAEIRDSLPADLEWVIRGRPGTSDGYEFVVVPYTAIEPSADFEIIEVPDATPQLVKRYRLSDEQALLAIVRYNRLLDLFTNSVTYSLQSHLRTQVNRQQLEVDELYAGVGRDGQHYVLPVQAKGGNDKLGRIQLEQDILLCKARFPDLECRAIAAQFMAEDVVALFELTIDEGDVVEIVLERHYRLVL